MSGLSTESGAYMPRKLHYCPHFSSIPVLSVCAFGTTHQCKGVQLMLILISILDWWTKWWDGFSMDYVTGPNSSSVNSNLPGLYTEHASVFDFATFYTVVVAFPVNTFILYRTLRQALFFGQFLGNCSSLRHWQCSCAQIGIWTRQKKF